MNSAMLFFLTILAFILTPTKLAIPFLLPLKLLIAYKNDE